jgi:hypothetical protein
MDYLDKFCRKRNMSSDIFFLSWRETKSLPHFVAASSSSLHITRGEGRIIIRPHPLTRRNTRVLSSPLTYGVNILVPIAGGVRLNPITAGARLSPHQVV